MHTKSDRHDATLATSHRGTGGQPPAKPASAPSVTPFAGLNGADTAPSYVETSAAEEYTLATRHPPVQVLLRELADKQHDIDMQIEQINDRAMSLNATVAKLAQDVAGQPLAHATTNDAAAVV